MRAKLINKSSPYAPKKCIKREQPKKEINKKQNAICFAQKTKTLQKLGRLNKTKEIPLEKRTLLRICISKVTKQLHLFSDSFFLFLLLLFGCGAFVCVRVSVCLVEYLLVIVFLCRKKKQIKKSIYYYFVLCILLNNISTRAYCIFWR